MKQLTLLITTIMFLAFWGGGALAKTSAKTNSSNSTSNQMTHEQREKMASLHEKMAKCLRSDKPLSDCRAEMRHDCQNMMGAQGCPMWGEMGGHMMRGAMGNPNMMNQGGNK